MNSCQAMVLEEIFQEPSMTASARMRLFYEKCDFSNRNLVMMKAVHAILYHARFSHARLEAAELRNNDLRLAAFNQAA